MTEHRIHDRLPSGFTFADRMQARNYETKGFVPGAQKIALVKTDEGIEVAARLAPPKYSDTVTRRGLIREAISEAGVNPENVLSWYIEEYNKGWQASRRGSTVAWESGRTSHAYDDGYLDAAAGRPKWHLTHCIDHDECGEG